MCKGGANVLLELKLACFMYALCIICVPTLTNIVFECTTRTTFKLEFNCIIHKKKTYIPCMHVIFYELLMMNCDKLQVVKSPHPETNTHLGFCNGNDRFMSFLSKFSK